MNKQGNTSSAVMNQRHAPRHGLDDFPTPPWGVRALIECILRRRFPDLGGHTVWEPTCNRGYMARPLAESFRRVHCTDIADYGWAGQEAVSDFLTAGVPDCVRDVPLDWIIFNPPFNKAAAFVKRALALRPRVGVAALVRFSWLEGEERYAELFERTPPAIIVNYAQRLPMCEGRYDPKLSTATAYCWVIWLTDVSGDTIFTTIPPVRDKYKFASDVYVELRDGSDWHANAANDTPLFAHASGEG